MQMKQKDRQSISQLERRLKAEQEARGFAEKQLTEEKKRKKLEEATAARAVAFAAASRYVPATRVFKWPWLAFLVPGWMWRDRQSGQGGWSAFWIADWLFPLRLRQLPLPCMQRVSQQPHPQSRGVTVPHRPPEL